MSYAIGIDVGGTKIAAGLVDTASGAVILRAQRPTDAARGGAVLLDDVLDLARQLDVQARTQGHAPIAVGLGVCELVDRAGNVTSDFTIAWSDTPVQDALSAVAPAIVQADVRAHALAEAVFGAGSGQDPFVFASIGTGISACLVQGRVPYEGARGNALVLATGPISVPGDDGALRQFVLEEYASGAALARRFGVDRVERIVDAAAAGDASAERLLRDAGTAVGGALGWLASVLDPAAVVVGGGLGSAPGLYWDALHTAVRAHIWSDATRTLLIRQAALGRDAGIVGAALYGERARGGLRS
jgi:glucokinase